MVELANVGFDEIICKLLGSLRLIREAWAMYPSIDISHGDEEIGSCLTIGRLISCEMLLTFGPFEKQRYSPHIQEVSLRLICGTKICHPSFIKYTNFVEVLI